MLFKIALGLLAVWAFGVAGVVPVGRAVHVVLLVALMLLLLSFAKARETATRQERGGR